MWEKLSLVVIFLIVMTAGVGGVHIISQKWNPEFDSSIQVWNSAGKASAGVIAKTSDWINKYDADDLSKIAQEGVDIVKGSGKVK